MSDDSEKKKVFISYAREDRETAWKLYNVLRKAGLALWMDKANLVAGQNWKYEISQAIKKSDYLIALLSSIPPNPAITFLWAASMVSGDRHIRHIRDQWAARYSNASFHSGVSRVSKSSSMSASASDIFLLSSESSCPGVIMSLCRIL